MKTKTSHLAVTSAIVLLLNPFMLKAQSPWSAVRYDHHNIFRHIASPTANTVFVTGTEPVSSQHFLLRTNDAGTTWDSISFDTGGDHYVLTELFFLDANTGFVGGVKNFYSQVLLKTTDNGNTWTNIAPNPSLANSIPIVNFIDGQNGFATMGGTDLYKTLDGGTTWTSVPAPCVMRDLYFFNMNSGLACGENGMAVLMRTYDGGQNWYPIFGDYDSSLSVNSFSKLDVISSNVFFTAMENSNKLYRTTSHGDYWETMVIDSISSILDFDFVSADVGHVLAEVGWGQEYRILLTVDGGYTWTMEYTTGWNFYGGGVTLNSFSFVEQTGYAAGSNGLVKKYFPSTAGVNEEVFSSTASIYPNPAHSTLSVALPHDKKVIVINLLGNVVMEKIFPGKNNTELDVSSLSPGVYFVKAGNAVTKFIKE